MRPNFYIGIQGIEGSMGKTQANGEFKAIEERFRPTQEQRKHSRQKLRLDGSWKNQLKEGIRNPI